MLDRDLASLYEVETKRLKEQVKRNLDRFPTDFMFELTKEEFHDLRSQFCDLKLGGAAIRADGVYRTRGCNAFQCILNSKRAIRHLESRRA